MRTVARLLLSFLALSPLAVAQELEVHFIALATHGESLLVRTPQAC